MIIVELSRNDWFIGEIFVLINKIYGDIIQVFCRMSAENSGDARCQRQNFKNTNFSLDNKFYLCNYKNVFF